VTIRSSPTPACRWTSRSSRTTAENRCEQIPETAQATQPLEILEVDPLPATGLTSGRTGTETARATGAKAPHLIVLAPFLRV
jgi:hypothetical protein